MRLKERERMGGVGRVGVVCSSSSSSSSARRGGCIRRGSGVAGSKRSAAAVSRKNAGTVAAVRREKEEGVGSLSWSMAALSVASGPATSRGDSVVCGAKKGKYGESYVFQVIRGDNEEDEALFRRFKRNVVSSHVLIEGRRRKFFEGKIARHKRKLKMKSIERRLYSSPSVPKIMTMAQRREMEAAGRIPGYNPLTRSPFLADMNPSMQRGFQSSSAAASAQQQPSASDIFLGSGVEGEMDVESLFGSKLNAGEGAADPVALFGDDDKEEETAGEEEEVQQSEA